MKKIFTLACSLLLASAAYSQNFNKNLGEARTAYTAGNLSSSRFAMEQMLRELDGAIAKELLKILPAKMDALSANLKDDNTSAAGGLGLFVQRTYGTDPNKSASVDIMNNSPLINSLNALLALPFVANMGGDSNQKVVKIQGYKAVLNKSQHADTGKTDYELQIPLQNTLVSFKMDDTKEADMLRLAATLPLEKIAQIAK